MDSRKLQSDGPHLLEIRCRAEKQAASSGFKVRFKQVVVSNRTWSQHTVSYTYDALERLLEARYQPGVNTAAADADLLRRYQYTFDRAHNRLSESLAVNGGAPTVKSFTYNAANQISSAGYTYDDNGNLTHDGTNAYTWDRANRLLAMGGSAYQYDALGNRIQQTVGASVSGYLNDLGAGLPTVLRETSGGSVTRYLHGPRGLHQLQTPGGGWQHAFVDALGSLRLVTDSAAAVLDSRSYGPYGDPFGQAGTPQTGYGYSGEPTDANGLVYDRARYFSPALGQFPSLDPLEVFNRYAYVNGNPVMRTDPSGMLILMSETGGVSAKPVVKTTPVVRWAQNANPNPQPTVAAQNANPNPQPYSPPRTITITPVTPWAQNANPNPQPAAPPAVSTPNTAANVASIIGPEPPPQRSFTSTFYNPLLQGNTARDAFGELSLMNSFVNTKTGTPCIFGFGCSAPGNLRIDWCMINPSTLGCSGNNSSTILQTNLGKFYKNNLLRFVNWCNNAFCMQGEEQPIVIPTAGPIITMPGVTLFDNQSNWQSEIPGDECEHPWVIEIAWEEPACVNGELWIYIVRAKYDFRTGTQCGQPVIDGPIKTKRPCGFDAPRIPEPPLPRPEIPPPGPEEPPPGPEEPPPGPRTPIPRPPSPN